MRPVRFPAPFRAPSTALKSLPILLAGLHCSVRIACVF